MLPRWAVFSLNTLIPGAGVMLRHAGLWLMGPLVVGVGGLSLVAVALATPGSHDTAMAGWLGLAAWAVAAAVATGAWAVLEQPSSRDLSAIQPLFREVAAAYLGGRLPQAEQAARRLARLAAGEPGAWRLLAMVLRAQGRTAAAGRLDRRAARLDLVRR